MLPPPKKDLRLVRCLGEMPGCQMCWFYQTVRGIMIGIGMCNESKSLFHRWRNDVCTRRTRFYTMWRFTKQTRRGATFFVSIATPCASSLCDFGIMPATDYARGKPHIGVAMPVLILGTADLRPQKWWPHCTLLAQFDPGAWGSKTQSWRRSPLIRLLWHVFNSWCSSKKFSLESWILDSEAPGPKKWSVCKRLQTLRL